MSRLIKFISISFIPILSVLLILLFLNTVLLDYRYAHKSLVTYQNPFDWATYKLQINLVKFIKNLKNNKKTGLTKKKIYITDKSQKNLLSDVPMSTKIWQQGFFLLENNELKKIKIRYRGDNPRNWLFEKKNLRIKSTKKNQFGKIRYYDYDPYTLNKFVSGKIANKIGIISPKYKLIELYINDKSEGIYIETEKINENFLRRNKIMPVNIYKGEQINSESLIKTNNNLFNNPAIWKKIAFFNQVNKDDKSDLINFLNLLRESENNYKSNKKLIGMLDLTEWGKFAAYQILTDNYHNDNGHNMRIIFDPWSGKIRPIIYDPILGNNIFNLNKINLNNSSHELLLLLNKNSSFIDIKYKELFNLISLNKIIKKQIEELKNLEDKILISENRDVEIQQSIFNNLTFVKKINPSYFLQLSDKKKRFALIKNLSLYNKSLLKKFSVKPQASWSFTDDKINININDDMPISNIKITFNKEIPKWISIDFNGDKILDNSEKFNPDKNGIFNIPLTLYSNRLVVARNKLELNDPKIIFSNTRFEFKVNNSIKPYIIEAQNPFINKKFQLNYDNSPTVLAHKYNLPLLKDPILKNEIKILEGTIVVDKNLIFKTKVKIMQGTKFLIDKDVSIVFLNSVNAVGSKLKPIIFRKNNDKHSNNNWGSIVLQGQKTKNSKFKNIIIDGGSGAKIDQFIYTSMFSLHNTSDVILEDISLVNNNNYDDALHLVYCKNILLKNIFIKDAFSDALDIDISENVYIKNSKFDNPNNDSIDIMESRVLIDNTEIYNSGDKGISVGENSNAVIHNSYLDNNKIGLAVKDNSSTNVVYTDFINNNVQIDSYEKNYKYGNGGLVKIYKSNFNSSLNIIKSDKKSEIFIYDSSFNKNTDLNKPNIKLFNKISFNGDKKSNQFLQINRIDTMLNHVDKVKKMNLRGSDFTNK